MNLVETITTAKQALINLKNSEKELLEKVAFLEAKLNHIEKAEALAIDHLNKGYFSTELFSEKLAEYKKSSPEDLKILEKAAALMESNSLSFGSLSDKTAPGKSGNALIDCLLED